MSFLFINVNHDVGFESSESIPISLGYVLATLKDHEWDGIIVDDVRDRPLTLNALEKLIRRFEPTVIGFTAYQGTMERIRYLCRYIKSRHRAIRVILGGPQIVPMPPAALEHLEDVDGLVCGEGEMVMLGVASALDAGEQLTSVDGMVCRAEGRIVDKRSGLEPPENLDAYSSPYLMGLLNLRGKDTAILLSSRGCRHVCRFCITPSICKGKIRYHSIERTLAEMELLADQGIGRFWFADPNFTENKERTERLLQMKMDRGIKTPFWCQTRSDLVDASLLEKLRDAGADTIAFGLESGSPGILEGTNKKILLDQVRDNVMAARSLGLETELFTIFGLPGETVEEARKTLEFVKSLGIPVQSNSGSQQMQLYFGSVYSKNPSRWGFKPLPRYRPHFLSIGDEFETNGMSRRDMRKVKSMWVLANEQMQRDVYFKQNIFDVLGFLLGNREYLRHEPDLYLYGALASAAIEEFDILLDFLQGFEAIQDGNRAAVEELVSGLSFFKESEGPAGSEDRIIFDSRSFLDGVPFTGISGKYWDVLLGKGLLLQSFEDSFVGVGPGDDISFKFEFPEDYIQEELRGKKPEVHARIHKVFKPVRVQTVDDVRRLNIRNTYDFSDLDLLRERNEILYYLALKGADPETLMKAPSHFLALMHRLARLSRREAVDRLASLAKANPRALKAVADALFKSGKCTWALEYYEALPDGAPSTVVKRAQCLLESEDPFKAINLIETIPEQRDLEFQQTLLRCLKLARPKSDRIPSLEHHVMDLRVNAAIERERVYARSGTTVTPIIHGLAANE